VRGAELAKIIALEKLPAGTTVALKHENAFARRTAATRWAWLVRAKSWLLLAETQEIAENRIKADQSAA
jgi:hypothetical protein